MSPKQLYELCRDAVSAWVDDFAPSMGAAISYYTMFSLAPLLVIVIAVAGALFGREAVQGEIVQQLGGLIGHDGATAVQGLVASASEPKRGLIAGSIGLAVLLVGATTVFAELQSALDRIWHVPEADKPSGLWALLRARVLSFGLILGLAFLLMVSLIVSAGLAVLGSWTGGLMPGWELLLQGVNILISVSVSTLLFAMIFKLMPTAPIAWRDVWIGAAVTAVLFEIGKALIGLYLGKSGMTESFAAAGWLVVLLAWVYYAAQIFLLGAEFTKVYANAHGSVAGAKAVAATEHAKHVAKAGTDLVAQPAPPAIGKEAVARTVETEREVSKRLDAATQALARQVAAFAIASIASAILTRWQKRRRQQMRRQRL